MKTIVFYHNADIDGRASAAILLHFGIKADELIGVDYSDKPNLNYILEFDRVFILDFSFDDEVMFKLFKSKPQIIWIDHHRDKISRIIESSESNYLGSPNVMRIDPLNIIGIESNSAKVPFKFRDIGDDDCIFFSELYPSACELTWKFFAHESVEEAPYAVRLMSLYDTWKHDVDPLCVDFDMGLKSLRNGPEDPIWSQILPPISIKVIDDKNRKWLKSVYEVIDRGDTIKSYFKLSSSEKIKKRLYTAVLDMPPHLISDTHSGKLSVLCCNYGKGSKQFEPYYNRNNHDLCCAFERDSNQWVYHLYRLSNDKVSATEVAISLGGGGHTGGDAAGWSSIYGPDVFFDCDFFDYDSMANRTVSMFKKLSRSDRRTFILDMFSELHHDDRAEALQNMKVYSDTYDDADRREGT